MKAILRSSVTRMFTIQNPFLSQLKNKLELALELEKFNSEIADTERLQAALSTLWLGDEKNNVACSRNILELSPRQGLKRRIAMKYCWRAVRTHFHNMFPSDTFQRISPLNQ